MHDIIFPTSNHKALVVELFGALDFLVFILFLCLEKFPPIKLYNVDLNIIANKIGFRICCMSIQDSSVFWSACLCCDLNQ